MAKQELTEKQIREAEKAADKLKQESKEAEKRADKLLGAVSHHAGDFMDFVREQGVVGLAIGLAIGTAAGDSVRQIVEGFINPMITLLVGSQERLVLAQWHVEIGKRSADFAWGAVLSSLITLMATALVIYWVVRVARLDRLDKKKGKA